MPAPTWGMVWFRRSLRTKSERSDSLLAIFRALSDGSHTSSISKWQSKCHRPPHSVAEILHYEAVLYKAQPQIWR